MLADLSESEVAFLDALRGGESANGYARRVNYSNGWAKKKSRQIRDKLGVQTIEEALVATDDDQDRVSRADFDKLTGLVARLGDSLEDLAKARPADQPAAQLQVREHTLDLKDHAKALGLSLEDVERLKGEKEYENFKKMQDRLDAERAEEEDLEDDDDANGAGGKGLGEVIRDGLGGIKNVKPKP